jgi:hypothetical protein
MTVSNHGLCWNFRTSKSLSRTWQFELPMCTNPFLHILWHQKMLNGIPSQPGRVRSYLTHSSPAIQGSTHSGGLHSYRRIVFSFRPTCCSHRKKISFSGLLQVIKKISDAIFTHRHVSAVTLAFSSLFRIVKGDDRWIRRMWIIWLDRNSSAVCTNISWMDITLLNWNSFLSWVYLCEF